MAKILLLKWGGGRVGRRQKIILSELWGEEKYSEEKNEEKRSPFAVIKH